MILVLVHGISNNRPANWVSDWAARIEPLLGREPSQVVAVSWERVHESSYEPARSARQNILQDLGALHNPAVKRYVDTKLLALRGHTAPIWIIAHSLGTAIIWQTLAYWQAQAGVEVSRLITVGSPLWLPYSRIVRRVVSLNATMPRARKPINVRRWINVAGRFDCVAGFGLVCLPGAIEHRTCWSTHSFGKYAKTSAFRDALG